MKQDDDAAGEGGVVPWKARPAARALVPGLYLVSTPIGAARDITLRALDILAAADMLVAEDTRTLRHLMEIHAIPLGGRHILAYHDHNGAQMRPRIEAALMAGQRVAYASEAGTPLVADPGYRLAQSAIAAGAGIFAAPGASAVLAALAVGGLPTDRFLFAGFLPAAAGARRTAVAEVAGVAATLVFYESPKRIHRTLVELCDGLGADRQAAVCRELTKRFEEVSRGTLGTLAGAFAERDVKGEIVVLVDRAPHRVADAEDMATALRAAMEEMSLKDASTMIADRLGLPRRMVYQAGLRLAAPKGDDE